MKTQFSLQQSFGKSILAACMAIAFAISGIGSSAFGQFKYNPNDDEIQQMTKRGVDYLTSISPGGGEGYLAALAAAEWSKRYEGVVPRTHPQVVKATNNILNRLSDPNSINYMMKSDSMYEPCLALILLCDIGDEKYANEIRALIKWLEGRQLGSGSFCYNGRPGVDDTSQTQYAALAMFVAKHHGFSINPQVAKRALEWLVKVQVQGSWYYQYQGLGAYEKDKFSLSMHCSGLGTVYLLADVLQLTPRSRKGADGNGVFTGLPPSVSIYVKPKDGQEVDSRDKKGPLVSFNTGGLSACKSRGNQFLNQNWNVEIIDWNYYYLYALERYAFFREQAEGQVKEIPDWYDQGVEFLKAKQQANGSFERGRQAPENGAVSTALAVLFLLRSSEVLILPPNDSTLNGGIGFANDVKLKVKNDGSIVSANPVKGVEDIFELLNSDNDEEVLQQIIEGMKFSISEFVGDDAKSAGEKKAFLRSLIMEKNYFRRLIAVKMLSGEQDMDNVPALLYALSDPDMRIATEAHNGLRLISRRINSVRLSAAPSPSEFMLLKDEWTKWFLKIRPDADLLDD